MLFGKGLYGLFPEAAFERFLYALRNITAQNYIDIFGIVQRKTGVPYFVIGNGRKQFVGGGEKRSRHSRAEKGFHRGFLQLIVRRYVLRSPVERFGKIQLVGLRKAYVVFLQRGRKKVR